MTETLTQTRATLTVEKREWLLELASLVLLQRVKLVCYIFKIPCWLPCQWMVPCKLRSVVGEKVC